MTTERRLALISPGWGNSTFNLRMVESKFKSEGFDVIIVLNDGKGIKESAAKVRSVVDNVYPYYDHICFVGYSMGGLVGRYLVSTDHDHIDSYVSIGTPHSGCYLAEVARWSKTAGEMKRSSQFIKELDELHWPLQVPALAIQAGMDEVVRPLDNSKFKHAENIMIPHASHLSVVMSSRTFYEIYSWLCSIFFPDDFHEAPNRKGVRSRITEVL